MKYVAQDGKVFENENRCIAYENNLKMKAEQEKDKRWDEVTNAKENYIKLYEQYTIDYPSPCRKLIASVFI